MSHLWMSRVTPWVISHVWIRHATRDLFRHGTIRGALVRAHGQPVTSYRRPVCHDSLTCAPWLICRCAMIHSHVYHDSFMCVPCLIHVCDLSSSCPPREWDVSHVRMSHVTHEWVMSPTWMSHVTHEWAVSHMQIRHGTHVNESCRPVCNNSLTCQRMSRVISVCNNSFSVRSFTRVSAITHFLCAIAHSHELVQ